MKKGTILNFIIGLIVCLLFWGCPMDKRYGLYLDNHSDQTVTIFINNDGVGLAPIYPYTSLVKSFVFLSRISPHSIDDFREGSAPWWKDIGGVDTLSFVIVSVDTLNKYSWDEIRSSYNILQRYDLSRNDLRLLDATIHYPPTETMRNMKMYPAYGKSK